MMILIGASFASTFGEEWEEQWALARVARHHVKEDCVRPNERLMHSMLLVFRWDLELYDRDQAAWKSSDDLFAAGRMEGLTGWLTGDIRDGLIPIHWIREGKSGPASVHYAEYNRKTADLSWPDPHRSPTGSHPVLLPEELVGRWACRQEAVLRTGVSLPTFTNQSPNFVVVPISGEPWVHVMPPIEDDDDRLFGGVSVLNCEASGEISELHFSSQLTRIPKAAEENGLLIRQNPGLAAPWPHWRFQARHAGMWLAVRTQQELWLVDDDSYHWLGTIPIDEKRAVKEAKKMDRQRLRLTKKAGGRRP